MYTVKRTNGQNQNLTTLEQHFQYIEKHFNFDFYNAYGGFCIQLFDKEFFSNYEVDCIMEFQGNSITEVISQTINWIDNQTDEST